MMPGGLSNKVPPSALYSSVSLNSGVSNNNGRLSNFDFYKDSKMELITNKVRSTNPISWDHSSSDINELLSQKYHKVISRPGVATYDSLVGQISYVIGHKIISSGEGGCYLPNGHGNDSFYFKTGPNNDDIVVQLARGTYSDIISKMIDENVANKDTAVQILECISRPCEMNDSENLATLGPKIFEGLQDLEGGKINPAKKLVAVLICEAIRFKDNGASVRMAIRKVIDLYDNSDPEPFKKVFIGEDNDPIAVFALSGGRKIMEQQIIGDKGIVDFKDQENFQKHHDAIEKAKDNISDDEDPQPQSNSNFNTANAPRFRPLAPNAIHSMHDKSRYIERDLYKDPSSESSTTPTPSRKTIYSSNRGEASYQETSNFLPLLTNNGFGDAENDDSDYKELLQKPDLSFAAENYDETFSPTVPNNLGATNVAKQRARFCRSCCLFYSCDIESDNEHLKACPKCNSEVERIPRSHLTLFINGISEYKEANDLPDGVEGYYIELGNFT